jgi:hypothetical protein
MPTVTLNDGLSTVNIPDDMPQDQQQSWIQQKNAQITQQHMQAAATANAPYVPRLTNPADGSVQEGKMVYSATAAYPNSSIGNALAWSDHNLGGNWANRNIADPLNSMTGGQPTESGQSSGGAPSALRMGTNALTGAYDLPATVYNVGKHYAAPAAGTSGDLPVVAPALQADLGVSGDPNAPFWQRALEAGGSGTAGTKLLFNALSPRTIISNLGLGTTATLGGDIGSKNFGEIGGTIGSLVGGGIEPVARAAVKSATRPFVATRPPEAAPVDATQPAAKAPVAAAPPPPLPHWMSSDPMMRAAAGYTFGGLPGAGLAWLTPPLLNYLRNQASNSDLVQNAAALARRIPPDLLGHPYPVTAAATTQEEARREQTNPTLGWLR